MRGTDAPFVKSTRFPTARIVVSILFAAIGFGALCATPLPARWAEVRPGWLYRSRQIPAANVEAVLRNQRIDVVIDLSDEPVDPTRDAEAAAARALGIRYLHVPVSSGAEHQVSGFARAVAGIAQAHARGERVLVHCKLGYRRTAMAIALYERIVEDAEPRSAYRELRRFKDAFSDWHADTQAFLERHLPAIAARVDAELTREPFA